MSNKPQTFHFFAKNMCLFTFPLTTHPPKLTQLWPSDRLVSETETFKAPESQLIPGFAL